MELRKANFAGSWYPDDAQACEAEIKRFMDAPGMQDEPEVPPAGGIVPHAGWYFSGKIACQVIQRLLPGDPPDVIVIFGMHLHPNSPNHIMVEGAWDTPFGPLEIETGLARRLNEAFDFQVETVRHHTQDNTIELQLPFIKYFFSDVKIAPMGVPPHDGSLEVGRAAADFAAEMGLKTRVIGSTDLTHYGYNYGFSPHGSGKGAVEWVREENDRRVIDAMLAMDPAGVIKEGLANQNACCAGAAAAAIAAGKKMGASRAEMMTYATSYDKSPGDSFVGYAGIIFW